MKESAKILGVKFDDCHCEFEISGSPLEVIALLIHTSMYIAREEGLPKEWLGSILIDLPNWIENDIMSKTIDADLSSVPDALDLIKRAKESNQ